MLLTFDDRPSDSPFVERIWRSRSEGAGTFSSIAMSHWEMDFSIPAERIATVNTPILVIDGGKTPRLSHSAQAVAEVLTNAERHTLKGQPHNVAPEAMAPVLIEFFNA